jgi:hypothetical protein
MAVEVTSCAAEESGVDDRDEVADGLLVAVSPDRVQAADVFRQFLRRSG